MRASRSALPLRQRGPVDPALSRRVAPQRPGPVRLLTGDERSALLTEVLGFVAVWALVINYLMGLIFALMFIVAATGVAVLAPRKALGSLWQVAPLFALPLLALLSAAWSEAPGTTTRAALEVVITAAAAAVLGGRCQERTLILGAFAGLFTVCSTAIPEIPEGLRSGWPVLGAFGSKNSMGIHAQFFEVFALAVAFDRGRAWPTRLVGLLALPLSLLLIYLARSGGASVLAAVTLALLPALLLFGRMPLWARISGMASAVVVLIAGLILAPQIAALIAWFRTDVMGKDATLTGRTELWDIAERQLAERPLLGHGYFAFWRPGNPEAEAVWRSFGLAGGGFNFHNEFMDIAVALGKIGVGLLVVLCLLVAGLALARHILRPSFHSAIALIVMVSIYARAVVETELIAPFSMVLMLWFIVAARAVTVLRGGRAQAKAAQGGWPATALPAGGIASFIPRSALPLSRGWRGQMPSRRD